MTTPYESKQEYNFGRKGNKSPKSHTMHENRDNIYSQSQAASFLEEDVKKNKIKYHYLTIEQSFQLQRQSKIFWLQCFAMFIFIYSSTCAKDNTGIDLHFFVGILVAIPICARQTGANLNPAVSFAMTFKAKDRPFVFHPLLWLYIKAQIIGAVLSMFLAVQLNGVYRSPLYPHYLSEESGLNQFRFQIILQIVMSQAVGVFILIFMILYVTGPYTFITNNGAKFVYISTFVYIGRKFAASSGNQINVALTISQAFVGFFQCNFLGFKYLIFWILGDILGVIIAASLYNYVFEPLLEYLQQHKTHKQMLKVQAQRQLQIKQSSKLLERPNKQQVRQKDRKGHQNSSESDNAKQYKDYTKKLQFF